MNPYLEFVQQCARLGREGRSHPLGGFAPCPRPDLPDTAAKVLIFSPHPDDEVIIGGLALRLMREVGWRVVNVAVTQGSDKNRQEERLEELRQCCACIGFELEITATGGLEKISVQTRQNNPLHWSASVEVIAGILARHQPRAILFPHEADWNSTHIGTHWLVLDALRKMSPGFTCHTVETEFWGQMTAPNLMVEITVNDLADLITALTFHVGEVRRNPYHLTLAAWMIDNVRRGGELVGGQGGAAPRFDFGTLYRLRKWADGRFIESLSRGRFLASDRNPAELFS